MYIASYIASYIALYIASIQMAKLQVCKFWRSMNGTQWKSVPPLAIGQQWQNDMYKVHSNRPTLFEDFETGSANHLNAFKRSRNIWNSFNKAVHCFRRYVCRRQWPNGIKLPSRPLPLRPHGKVLKRTCTISNRPLSSSLAVLVSLQPNEWQET